MRIYTKNIPAKFHPGPIWNDAALGFFEERQPNKKNNSNQMSIDMRSVHDLKNGWPENLGYWQPQTE